MQGNNRFQDRFSQYLTRRVGAQRAQEIVYSGRKQPMHTPVRTIQSYDKQQYSHTASLDSSALSFSQTMSQSSRRGPVHPSSYEKTVSVRKRLRKMKEVQDNVCSICLQDFVQKVRMSCRHEYCRQCLCEWLKNSSRCPYCRQDCQYFESEGQKIQIQKVRFEYEPEPQLGQEYLDYECYICSQTHEGDTVIICDRCETHACHIECDMQLHGNLPAEDSEWFCHFCR